MTRKDKHGIPKSALKARNKRVITINDILTRDEVNSVLTHLEETKQHITDLILIAMDRRDGKYHWMITENTLVSTATWMLESTKLDLLSEEDEE